MPTVQDLYKAQVLAELPSNYWVLDETSGLFQDSSPSGGNMQATSGPLTYDVPGPFSGARGCRFSPANVGGAFQSLTHANAGIGDTCVAQEWWIRVLSLPSSRSIVFESVWTADELDADGTLTILHQFLGWGPPTQNGVGDGSWHYVRINREQGTGRSRVYIDGVEDPVDQGNWSIATPYNRALLGILGENVNITASIELSNVAWWRECPLPPLNYPPPVAANVQLPYLGVGP